MTAPSKRSKASEAAGIELCIVCGFDFASHEWLTPADRVPTGLEEPERGHDFTPIQGKPIRHSRWSPEPERKSE